jgi:hypothetical protein
MANSACPKTGRKRSAMRNSRSGEWSGGTGLLRHRRCARRGDGAAARVRQTRVSDMVVEAELTSFAAQDAAAAASILESI